MPAGIASYDDRAADATTGAVAGTAGDKPEPLDNESAKPVGACAKANAQRTG
jgi:hypothetical protein